VTEQPENRPEDATPDAEATSASWVPAEADKAESAEPTVVGPPADPNVPAGSEEGEAAEPAESEAESAPAAAESAESAPAAAEPAESAPVAAEAAAAAESAGADAAAAAESAGAEAAAAAESAGAEAASAAAAAAEPVAAAAGPAEPPVVPPPLADAAANDGSSLAAGPREDRPEVAVGAAFVGGFALAMILRRLAR
jgi:hypothetical protein